ncbi:glycosyltransferase family 2 protein [Aquabacterium sp.]|uniref:glycosyltransferase family 2 protein n=1 Tax=Aquabacterium sp. TaxID=1872578 RepID=UPI002D1B4586|nr:glycosyltransferase family 2 protein [Aquabacterium sp.]HSW04853.1 glycosyltransferase family 2 protein [Aquabacterium sp.]
MVRTLEKSQDAAASGHTAQGSRASIKELLSPWEEFRRVIPLVSLKSLLHRPHPSVPKVAVLLCTMQAQHFLAEQLNSIATQTHPAWAIWASDDGSDDYTHAILEYYQSHWSEDRLSIHAGPAEGSTANFLSLTCRADIDADYFAYADQDDIWEADKLERAVDWLKTIPSDVPALYGSRTLLVDARNQHIGYSPLFEHPPSFRNALVQSIAGGNTMVFNRAARDLLRAAGENIEAVTHDWWAYMLVTSCGGVVHYDVHPTVRYRQHARNQFGSNISPLAQMKRVRLLLQGRFRGWVDANLSALQRVRHLMTPESQQVLDEFVRARKRWLAPRLLGLRRTGIHRQTVLGNLGITLAALINRL